MGELSDSILGLYVHSEDRDYFGVSSVSSCPRETYLNYVNFLFKDRAKKKLSPEFKMLLKDGHHQEAIIVSLLRQALYKLEFTGKNQAEIHIGRSKTKGHPDGIIMGTIEKDYEVPRMLEVKARNYTAFSKFREQGIDGFPKMNVQIQLYMSAEDLPYSVEETHLIFKHKETTKLEDVKVKRNPKFAEKITRDLDSIIVDGQVPDPEKCELCDGCSFYRACWKADAPTIDFSGLQFASLAEASEKWIKGKAFSNAGKIMVEEAQEAFQEAIEDDTEELITDTLKILRVSSISRRFSKDLFMEKYGEEAYNLVCNYPKSSHLRPRQL